MANSWFRVYAEFASDPKVQMMPEHMQRRLIMLMCFRCNETIETLHETELAFALRISHTELAETKTIFVAKGFVDADWNLLNWDKRQFASDSSTERVRAFREKKKSGGLFDQDEDETDVKRYSNGLEQNRTDTEQIQKQPKPKVVTFVLPDWVDRDAWTGFEEMRKKQRAPLTDQARKLAVATLDKLRLQGHNATMVLEQSTMNCWKGLFELKVNYGNGGSNGNGNYRTKSDATLSALQRSIEKGRNQNGSGQTGSAPPSEHRGSGVRGFLG